MEAKTSGLSRLGSAVSGFFAVIARFFSEFGTAMAKGDLFVKLSLLWWGAGYFRRKQYVKAILIPGVQSGNSISTFLSLFRR